METKISNTLVNDTENGIIAYAQQIKDSKLDKFQSLINLELLDNIETLQYNLENSGVKYITSGNIIGSLNVDGTDVSITGWDDKADKRDTVSDVNYDKLSRYITKTINGTTYNIINAASIVLDGINLDDFVNLNFFNFYIQDSDTKYGILRSDLDATIAVLGYKYTKPDSGIPIGDLDPQILDTFNTAIQIIEQSTSLIKVDLSEFNTTTNKLLPKAATECILVYLGEAVYIIPYVEDNINYILAYVHASIENIEVEKVYLIERNIIREIWEDDTIPEKLYYYIPTIISHKMQEIEESIYWNQ